MRDTNFKKTRPFARVDRIYRPRAGLIWRPAESPSHQVSYGCSYQPSAESLALAANNKANASEVTRNTEVGTKLDLLDGALSVNAALFSSQRINIKNTDPDNPGSSINAGTQRTNGLELNANGRRLTWLPATTQNHTRLP